MEESFSESLDSHQTSFAEFPREFSSQSSLRRLCGEYIGIEQIEDGRSRLWYCNYELGTVDHRNCQVTAAKCRALLAGVKPSKQES